MYATSAPRRYFDNAATTFPKPPTVLPAIERYLTEVGASAGRGAYREAVESEHLLTRCRTLVRQALGMAGDDQVIFTLNGSDALNLAIKGALRPGDHAITTALDHNSVLRPLHAVREQQGVSFTVVPVDPDTTRLDPQRVADAVTPRTRLVAVNHASNVTGVIQPLEEIARLCRERDIWLLVDAAQSAGHLPIHFATSGIDLLATPGHKGLLGPLGTGVLCVRAARVDQLRTWREGGTGSVSELATQPEFAPDKFEAGSHNAVGIAGLAAALEFLLERGISVVRAHERALTRRMMTGLDAIAGLTWYGPRSEDQRVGVFSVRVAELEPTELAVILEQQFNLLTRAGLHCAPLAHEAIGTADRGGTTRLSLGLFLSEADVDAATQALATVAREVATGV